MIEWREEGLVLAVRPHGESAAILDVLTEERGRHSGVVRGGAGRRLGPLLQPGAQLDVTWTARLTEHLGHFRIEPVRSRATAMGDRLGLSGLAAVTALLATILPERDAHPPLYRRTVALLDLLPHADVWPLAYLKWELALLEEMGSGLDLTTCAVTGATEDLAFVSPRSGRAVARGAARAWEAKLLPLPPVLHGEGQADGPSLAEALGTTGWFLEHRLLAPGDRRLPAARARLVARIAALS